VPDLRSNRRAIPLAEKDSIADPGDHRLSPYGALSLGIEA